MNQILLAILGSGALSTLIASVIQAISNRRGRLKKIEEKLTTIEANQKTAETDSLRTQLLLMIADYPEEKTEILKIAEKYFTGDGNWVATAIFNKWLVAHCEGAKPEWFKGVTK